MSDAFFLTIRVRQFPGIADDDLDSNDPEQYREWIARQVDRAPPLSGEQKERIRRALNS